PPTIDLAMPVWGVLCHEHLELRRRCAGLVSHPMGMSVWEDNKVPCMQRHRPVSALHGEPACALGDDVEDRDLFLAKDADSPWRTQMCAAIECAVQVNRLEDIGKDVFLRLGQRVHRPPSSCGRWARKLGRSDMAPPRSQVYPHLSSCDDSGSGQPFMRWE